MSEEVEKNDNKSCYDCINFRMCYIRHEINKLNNETSFCKKTGRLAEICGEFELAEKEAIK